MNSTRNGLRFCGSIDEPPVSSSGNRTRPNSTVLHTCRSCAMRVSTSAVAFSADSTWIVALRLATASRLLTAGRSNPSRRHASSGSIASVVPPPAPAPIGQMSTSTSAPSSALHSAANAASKASNWCDTVPGSAGWYWL